MTARETFTDREFKSVYREIERDTICSVYGDRVEMFKMDTPYGSIFSLDDFPLKMMLEDEKMANIAFERNRKTTWAFYNLSCIQKIVLSFNRYGDALLDMWCGGK